MLTSVRSQDWVDCEMTGVDFGDKRLGDRAKRVLRSLSENPQASIPEATKKWSEIVGAYRLLDNEKVTSEKMLKPHQLSTIDRMKEHKVVLAVQDTTSLNYNGLKATTNGLGKVGDGRSMGLIMHNAYAISTEGLPLGTIDCNIFSRKTSKYKKSSKRAKTPIKKKESRKWADAVRRVTEATKDLDGTKIIHVMDREGDIYEVFSDAFDLNQSFIIRAKHNRRVNKSSRGYNDGQLLSAALASTTPLGVVDLEVNSRSEVGGKRTASVEIKAVKVALPAPRGKSFEGHNLAHKELEQTVIWIREIDYDEDIDPIDWKLITNVEISSADEVLLCVEYYCKRWHIEVFFRILKTGCRVQDCCFATADKIKIFVILLLIVAWHIQKMTLLARFLPRGNPDLIFSKQEQALLSKLILKNRPLKKYRLREYVTMLARLGGFINRKCDGSPGPEVLWRGWIKLKNLIHSLSVLEELGDSYV